MATKTIGGISGVLGELISVPPTPAARTKCEQSLPDDRKTGPHMVFQTCLPLLRKRHGQLPAIPSSSPARDIPANLARQPEPMAFDEEPRS